MLTYCKLPTLNQPNIALNYLWCHKISLSIYTYAYIHLLYMCSHHHTVQYTMRVEYILLICESLRSIHSNIYWEREREKVAYCHLYFSHHIYLLCILHLHPSLLCETVELWKQCIYTYSVLCSCTIKQSFQPYSPRLYIFRSAARCCGAIACVISKRICNFNEQRLKQHIWFWFNMHFLFIWFEYWYIACTCTVYLYIYIIYT